MSDLTKLDTLLHKIHIKAPLALRYQGLTCGSIILSKIAHQLWCNHPFGQRNKATERAVRVGVGGNRGGGWTKFEKGGRVGNMGWGGGGLHKIVGFKPLCQLHPHMPYLG